MHVWANDKQNKTKRSFTVTNIIRFICRRQVFKYNGMKNKKTVDRVFVVVVVVNFCFCWAFSIVDLSETKKFILLLMVQIAINSLGHKSRAVFLLLLYVYNSRQHFKIIISKLYNAHTWEKKSIHANVISNI